MTAQGIAVLGATGSVGENTLRVIGENAARYRVIALTAHRDDARLFELCAEHHPEYAVLVDAPAAQRLRDALAAAGLRTQVLEGSAALAEVVCLPQVDQVMAAIVGAAGLLPTLAAARAGKRVLLANKESLVMAGGLLMDAVREGGGGLLPIDSEHNAIFQCLPASGGKLDGVRRLVLTASGGPFLDYPLAALDGVTPEQACAHPKWRMGPKISVDSATMMNKGLEIIEAAWLFAIAPARIDVVIHPQSIVHSMVEYADGSVLAQLGCPDMRIPIAHALGWPQRVHSGAPFLDLVLAGPLEFRPLDHARFPSLQLARDAATAGQSMPVALNAANEEAVAAFLHGRLPFGGIARVVGRVLDMEEGIAMTSIEQILDKDAQTRSRARRVIDALGVAA